MERSCVGCLGGLEWAAVMLFSSSQGIAFGEKFERLVGEISGNFPMPISIIDIPNSNAAHNRDI